MSSALCFSLPYFEPFYNPYGRGLTSSIESSTTGNGCSAVVRSVPLFVSTQQKHSRATLRRRRGSRSLHDGPYTFVLSLLLPASKCPSYSDLSFEVVGRHSDLNRPPGDPPQPPRLPSMDADEPRPKSLSLNQQPSATRRYYSPRPSSPGAPSSTLSAPAALSSSAHLSAGDSAFALASFQGQLERTRQRTLNSTPKVVYWGCELEVSSKKYQSSCEERRGEKEMLACSRVSRFASFAASPFRSSPYPSRRSLTRVDFFPSISVIRFDTAPKVRPRSIRPFPRVLTSSPFFAASSSSRSPTS